MNKKAIDTLKKFWVGLLNRNPRWISIAPKQLLTEKNVKKLIMKNPRYFLYLKEQQAFAKDYIHSCRLNDVYCDKDNPSVKSLINHILDHPNISNINTAFLSLLTKEDMAKFVNSIQRFDDFDLSVSVKIDIQMLDEHLVEFIFEKNPNIFSCINAESISKINHHNLTIFNFALDHFDALSTETKKKFNVNRLGKLLNNTLLSESYLLDESLDWTDEDDLLLIDKYNIFLNKAVFFYDNYPSLRIPDELENSFYTIKRAVMERELSKVAVNMDGLTEYNDKDFL